MNYYERDLIGPICLPVRHRKRGMRTYWTLAKADGLLYQLHETSWPEAKERGPERKTKPGSKPPSGWSAERSHTLTTVTTLLAEASGLLVPPRDPAECLRYISTVMEEPDYYGLTQAVWAVAATACGYTHEELRAGHHAR